MSKVFLIEEEKKEKSTMHLLEHSQ